VAEFISPDDLDPTAITLISLQIHIPEICMNQRIALACIGCKRKIQNVKPGLVSIRYFAVVNGNCVLFSVENKGNYVLHGKAPFTPRHEWK
jgi:hypothetical protein